MELFNSRDGESEYAHGSPAGNPSPVQLAPCDLEIHRCLDRLEAVFIDEHRALRNMSPNELRSINARKSALLLELDRGQRTYKVMTLDPLTVARLRSVRGQLEQNMEHIARHVAALNEVIGVVRRSVQRSEADGTYSRIAQADAWAK